MIKMIPTKSGRVLWMGEEIFNFKRKKTQEMRKEIQMIFQDFLVSLNPRMNIGEIISEPL